MTTQQRDLLRWTLLVLAGLALTWLAVRNSAQLGTAGAPFLGRYRLQIGALTALAPLVAAALLLTAVRGWFESARWSLVLCVAYLGAFGWALALALVDGSGGLTRALLSTDSYFTDVADVGDDPLGYLSSFTARAAEHSDATRGHPPGPVLLLWALTRMGVTSHLGLGLLVTAVGAATVPLVLAAVRGVCGELPARRYVTVLALAPYALWVAVSVDAVVATLGAAMVVAGVRASDRARSGRRRLLAPGQSVGEAPAGQRQPLTPGQSVGEAPAGQRQPLTPGQSVGEAPAGLRQPLTPGQSVGEAPAGLRAALWATLCGGLLGLAALLSYAAPWLGLSVVCLYFARRRPFLNLATGLGALVPVLGADMLGFGWVDGLLTARDDYAARIGPHRSVLWWSGLSLVVLLLAAGPALLASLRKMRNTPGWPFLVGAGTAVAFSLAAGLARGGVEHAWLPFFPWLMVAAVAPERQGGEAPPAPLLLAGAGAVVAIVLEAVLSTPW